MKYKLDIAIGVLVVANIVALICIVSSFEALWQVLSAGMGI